LTLKDEIKFICLIIIILRFRFCASNKNDLTQLKFGRFKLEEVSTFLQV